MSIAKQIGEGLQSFFMPDLPEVNIPEPPPPVPEPPEPPPTAPTETEAGERARRQREHDMRRFSIASTQIVRPLGLGGQQAPLS